MPHIFTLIIFLGIFTAVASWGSVGHQIIASLAQSQLTTKTSQWIAPLISPRWNGTLSAAAMWADNIIRSSSNSTDVLDWQWSRPLHYVNIPDWECNYLRDRDCVDDICADGAIRNYSRRLTDTLDVQQREQALFFLIHFVGDLHQPLHTGFKGDYGGNNIMVRFMNSSGTRLHSLWDSGLISYRMKKDFASNESLYYDHIYRIMLDQKPTNPNDDDHDILQWINEGLHFLCTDIYFDDNNRVLNTSGTFNLNEKYYERNYPIIEQRLAQGGRRLGALLNRLESMSPSLSTSTSETTTTTIKPNKVCVSTYILIIFISVECFVGFVLALVILIRHKMKHRR